MRKLIDIEEENGTLERLQILAIKAKKDLKNYIQDFKKRSFIYETFFKSFRKFIWWVSK